MKDKYEKGLIMDPESGTLRPVRRYHYVNQWLYGVVEPAILKSTEFMMEGPIRARMFNAMATPDIMPREVVVSTEAACRFVDFIYESNEDNDSCRMAVTKCVCQTATENFRDPMLKDMALLYTANLYTTAKHKGIQDRYIPIETAEEAKEMLRYFDEKNLVHTVMYWHGSGQWTFVMCNCDDQVCIPFKAFYKGRTDQVLAGPEIVSMDSTKCLGYDACGRCLGRCIFDANSPVSLTGATTVDLQKCMGCGNCTTTCPSGARTMIPRADYKHEDKVTTKILLDYKSKYAAD